jgi:16S rRNA (uracil1498-N3)-methyltransferase
MKQFLLPVPPEPGPGVPLIRLSGKDHHYLVRVKRLAPGDTFPARLPDGEAVTVRVLSTGGGVLEGELIPEGRLSITKPASPPPAAAAAALPQTLSANIPPIILFQALPKAAKMDLIIRQAVEAGLVEIAPFEALRSVARLGADRAGKPSRWERIVKEARQHSGSEADTRVRPPCGTEELLDYWESLKTRFTRALGLILQPPPAEHFWETGGPDPLEQGGLHRYLDNRPGLVVIAIGPEGGFAPEELQRFHRADFKPVSLGDTILRTETAALYAAAAVRTILMESPSWQLKPAEMNPAYTPLPPKQTR